MPRNGSSQPTNRNCLICANQTNSARLGMDVCRACAVFYKRYHKRSNQFFCRSASGKCASGKGLNCKSCRLEHIKSRMAESFGAASRAQDCPSIEQSPSTSLSEPPKQRPLLEKLKTAYKWMSYARLSSETYARTDAPHPLRISLEEGPYFPGDFASLSVGIRILLSTSLQFGADVFPEFAALPEQDRWSIVVNFFYRFRVFEGCHRANLIFPNDPEKYFISFASWISGSQDELWRSASTGGDVEGAIKYIQNQNMSKRLQDNRQAVARVNPCAEEFLSIMVLMFFEETSNSDDIEKVGEKYRSMVLNELYAYYRDKLKLDNFAARLGEVMMLMQIFDKKKDLREQVEVMRLFNILPEDHFIYGLQKE